MLVNPSLPAKTVSEFIAYAKANPGKINTASRLWCAAIWYVDQVDAGHHPEQLGDHMVYSSNARRSGFESPGV
jgi:hypothetical protein